VDAAIYLAQGHSFLSHRRGELGAMMFWSVPFWYVFELYNLRLENWYYVFCLHTTWISFVLSLVAFATVLPACFFHAEALKAFGLWGDFRCRPFKPQPWVPRLMVFVGALSVVLPLIVPRLTFWMVWGATFWIPEVINYRTGAPSLLRELESGRPGRLLRLLAGGLWAGSAWEMLNYWARCKWIYTVPGFEDWKLFEMPLLGFLGFPALALEAFSAYSLLCHFLRGGRHWDAPSTLPTRPANGRLFALAAVMAVGIDFAGFLGMHAQTVRSRRPLLAELDGLDASAVARLRRAGIPTPERLYRRVRAVGMSEVAAQAGLGIERFEVAWRHAALSLHKGLGTARARQLQAAGITHVSDLASANAQELFRRLGGISEKEGIPPPRLAEVQVWIGAARVQPDGTPRR
jgi:hypothetical protein